MGKDLHLKIATILEDDDGDAHLVLEIYDDGDEYQGKVGGLDFSPMEAHNFGMNIMNTALKMEVYAAIIIVMRSHKLSEETIDDILFESDKMLFARRHSG